MTNAAKKLTLILAMGLAVISGGGLVIVSECEDVTYLKSRIETSEEVQDHPILARLKIDFEALSREPPLVDDDVCERYKRHLKYNDLWMEYSDGVTIGQFNEEEFRSRLFTGLEASAYAATASAYKRMESREPLECSKTDSRYPSLNMVENIWILIERFGMPESITNLDQEGVVRPAYMRELNKLLRAKMEAVSRDLNDTASLTDFLFLMAEGEQKWGVTLEELDLPEEFKLWIEQKRDSLLEPGEDSRVFGIRGALRRLLFLFTKYKIYGTNIYS